MKSTFLSLMLMITLGVFALAQQQQQTGGQMMSMDQMMQECRKHCEATNMALDRVIKQSEDARKSNDAAKMRTALENVQQQAQEMKKHMEMCGSMMGRMHMMHKPAAKPPQK